MSAPPTSAALDLTPLEARFIRAYMRPGVKPGEAAKEAGCRCTSEESFRVRGSQLLKKLNHPIQMLMAEAGLTSLDILRSVKEGMEAYRTNVAFDKDGQAYPFESPDFQARARYTDMAIRLAGGYPKQQMELPFDIEDGKIVITAEFATHTEAGEMDRAA